jgi:hypothetical protein
MSSILARKILLTFLILTATTTIAIAHPGSGIVVDQRGYVYFIDTGAGVWRIDHDGRLVKQEGPKFHWMALDEAGRFASVSLPRTPGAEVRAVGSQPTLIVASDFPLVVGEDGSLYYPEFGSDQKLRVIQFTPAGARSIHATIPGDLHWLNGIASGPDGSLYYTDDRSVRKIDRKGVVSAVASNVSVPKCTPIPGIETSDQPDLRGLAVTPDGTAYVAASGCGALLKITPRGEISTVLRTNSPWSPTAVAVSRSGVYVLEYLHTTVEDRRAWVPRVRKISPDGSQKILATVARP